MDSTPLDNHDAAETTPDLRSGTFISDLHLFCPRSVSVETHRQLSQHQDASECIVLGGDIFDFRWSTYKSHDVPSLLRLPRRTCSDLLMSMRKMELAENDDVKRIFFGHTHVPINGIEVEGIKFFNPGGTLRHLKTHEHQFSLCAEEGQENGSAGKE